MRRSEYERLRRDLEREFKKKADALEKFWKAWGEDDSRKSPGITSLAELRPPQMPLSKAVRGALEKVSGDFSVIDIQRELRQIDSALAKALRPSISNVLRRLNERDGLIEKIKDGTPGEPTLYRKKAATQAL